MDRVGVGPRAIAVIIDSLIFFVAACCVIVAITLAAGGEIDETGGTAALLQLLSGLAYYAYFIILEGRSGTTLGKRILKLRVVKVDGSPLTMGDAVVRNLLRIVDSFFFYLVGSILVWTSPDKQRLGDRVAKTIVVTTAPGSDISTPYPPITPEQRF